jgi:hypothetical protein
VLHILGEAGNEVTTPRSGSGFAGKKIIVTDGKRYNHRLLASKHILNV